MTKHESGKGTPADAPAKLQQRAAAELALLSDERKAERRLRKRLAALAKEERRLAEAVERHSARLALVAHAENALRAAQDRRALGPA
ncbi:MAG: hypothetical protein JNM64_10375 [Chloroflexia bacterium]|nr:hypothetical protein [Chloroflexia bacterium]